MVQIEHEIKYPLFRFFVNMINIPFDLAYIANQIKRTMCLFPFHALKFVCCKQYSLTITQT